jgi:hypothetical protein
MTKNSARLLIVAAGLALLAGGWWLGQRSGAGMIAADTAPTPTPSPAPASGGGTLDSTADPVASATLPASSSSAPVAPTSATTPAALPEPLPPLDTPVAEMLDPLLERARRGDSGAACRLASELQRCRESAMRRGMRGNDMEARVAGERNEQRRESMIQAMARMEAEQERADRICEGIGDEQIALAFPLQMQAAQARPELRTWLAINPAIDTRMFLDHIDSWQQYRQVAMPWMEEAAARGDLSALIALARVHGDDRTFGPPIPPFRDLDEERFIAYATLMERYGLQVPPVQRAVEAARSRVDATVLEAAERRADSLFRPEAVIASPELASGAMRDSFQRAPQSVDCD